LYAEKFLKIQTKTMKLVPFKFNRVQRVLWKRILEKNLRTGKPVRWLILKGRQMGMSTWIAGLYYWICSLRSNRNAVVAAHKESSSVELFRKQQLFWRETPPNCRPMAKTNNRGHLEFANPNPNDPTPGLESQILVDVASNVDLGRSFALHLLHWSEFAMTANPMPTLAAARNAMPYIPGTFLIIETTAKGPGPFKDLWEDEDNDYEKIFICWVAEDAYRVEIDPDDYFEPHDADHPRYGNEEHERQRILHELKIWYPELTTEEELFHESMCRLAWRRQTIDGECGGDIRLFRQEYPTVPNDAFIGTGRSLFDSYKLADWMRGLVDHPPLEHTFRFDFRKQEFEVRKYGHLKLFEPVQEFATYVIGCDPALGVKGGDPSTAVILRCPELIQAGVFRAIIPPDEFAILLYHLGTMFNTALLAVEANEEGGYSVNKILGGTQLVDNKRIKYPRLYLRETLDGRRNKKQDKYGWKTSAVSKDIMITDLGNAINTDSIMINDRDTLHELMNFQEIVTESGRKSTGVPKGMGHDDLAIALMIAYQMAHRAYHQVYQPKAEKTKKYSLKWWEGQIEDFGEYAVDSVRQW
jgi:hypothetical protein